MREVWLGIGEAVGGPVWSVVSYDDGESGNLEPSSDTIEEMVRRLRLSNGLRRWSSSGELKVMGSRLGDEPGEKPGERDS